MGMDHGADEWASCPVAAEAGLWFRYGRQKRPGVTAASTFEAVLAGERSSTTRFLCWPGHAMWAAVRHGDLVREIASLEERWLEVMSELEQHSA